MQLSLGTIAPVTRDVVDVNGSAEGTTVSGSFAKQNCQKEQHVASQSTFSVQVFLKYWVCLFNLTNHILVWFIFELYIGLLGVSASYYVSISSLRILWLGILLSKNNYQYSY